MLKTRNKTNHNQNELSTSILNLKPFVNVAMSTWDNQ